MKPYLVTFKVWNLLKWLFLSNFTSKYDRFLECLWMEKFLLAFPANHVIDLLVGHFSFKETTHLSLFSFQEITTAIFLEQLHGSRMSEDFYHIKRLSGSTGSTCWKDMDINDKCRPTLLLVSLLLHPWSFCPVPVECDSFMCQGWYFNLLEEGWFLKYFFI